jgi:hypothetical protein
MRSTNHFILDFENSAFSSNRVIFFAVKNLYAKKNIDNLVINSKYDLFYIISAAKLTDNHSKVPSFNFYSFTQNLININFLRKERLYTKLKYSRSPAYDIVSGGTAAILAGFLGFLVSEKFGFELVDSGDFYYLLMYIVLFSFSLRPLLVSINNQNGIYSILSLYNIFYFFYFILCSILLNFKNRI